MEEVSFPGLDFWGRILVLLGVFCFILSFFKVLGSFCFECYGFCGCWVFLLV